MTCVFCHQPIFENETYVSMPPNPDATERRSAHRHCYNIHVYRTTDFPLKRFSDEEDN